MSRNSLKSKFNLLQGNYLILIAIFLGIICGKLSIVYIDSFADFISNLFMRFLKLLSLPMVFLSIVSTLSGMSDPKEAGVIGKKVIKYTIGTTVISATISLILFLVVRPAETFIKAAVNPDLPTLKKMSFLDHILQAIPENFVTPFIQGNIISIFMLGGIVGLSALFLPKKNKETLHLFFNSLFMLIMKMTMMVIKLIPIGIWAFVTLLVRDIRTGESLELKSILLYLLCVAGTFAIQGFIVLPVFLKMKKISPMLVMKGMSKALTLAFFSKSTGATLPVTIECAEENLKISKKVSRFVLPLCGTINMNACAGFIMSTILFVSTMNGKVFSPWEMFAWIFISTLGAMGNAAVPLGCYFVATSFLSGLNIPIDLMAVIFPFYSILDMFDTALNVWSDSCITAVTDKEIATEMTFTKESSVAA